VTRLRIATRRSALALAQSGWFARELERELGVSADLVPLETTGDRVAGSLAAVGGKGLFVKEIQEALLDGRADLAVHSAKDLPAQTPPELAISAVPVRADPRDALVARVRGARASSLPLGARVGTGSVRRSAQLLRLRPDLVIVPLRGNVQTRLRKLDDAALDAVVLACAGLARLSLEARIDERIDESELLPAVGQGALAIEAVRGTAVADDLAALDHAESAAELAAERAFQAALGGDCQVPIAARARARAGRLALRGLVIAPDASRIAEAELDGGQQDARELGAQLAERVLAAGGSEILDALRAGSRSPA
jgi:hydroxymethylbilane synthase